VGGFILLEQLPSAPYQRKKDHALPRHADPLLEQAEPPPKPVGCVGRSSESGLYLVSAKSTQLDCMMWTAHEGARARLACGSTVLLERPSPLPDTEADRPSLYRCVRLKAPSAGRRLTAKTLTHSPRGSQSSDGPRPWRRCGLQAHVGGCVCGEDGARGCVHTTARAIWA